MKTTIQPFASASTLPDFSRMFQKMKLEDKLLACRNTSFGDAIRQAVNSGKIFDAVLMIREQIALGNIDEIEWCIGASTLVLIDSVYPHAGLHGDEID